MRSSIIAIVALTGSWASAQNFGGEPSCAIPCLRSAISIAGCAASDEGCQCGTGISAIQSAVEPCFLSACNQSELQAAASIGLGLCVKYSASLASASATTTSGSAGVVTTTSSIPTTSVTAISTSVPATTSAPSSSSKAGSSSAASSSSKASSESSASAATSSSSSAGTAPTNVAPVVLAGVGGLIGVAAAFVAAL